MTYLHDKHTLKAVGCFNTRGTRKLWHESNSATNSAITHMIRTEHEGSAALLATRFAALLHLPGRCALTVLAESLALALGAGESHGIAPGLFILALLVEPAHLLFVVRFCNEIDGGGGRDVRGDLKRRGERDGKGATFRCRKCGYDFRDGWKEDGGGGGGIRQLRGDRGDNGLGLGGCHGDFEHHLHAP